MNAHLHLKTMNPSAIADPRVRLTIDTIQNRTAGRLEIAELALETNVSKSHLRHLFKCETGLALGHYIKLTRMQQAEVLLRTTFLSIKEIMYHVGMTSQSYFSREFRRAHGVPPSKYRMQSREG
jgi:AraC family transcriptional regulator, arabinose operon regulatory protein